MPSLTTRSEAFALVTHATKLYHVLSHVRDMIPESATTRRTTANLLVDMAKHAILDIERSVPRIEDAPGAWKDKWDIFGYQLSLGVSHTANFAYLVFGGMVYDGADEHLSQEIIEQLTNLRKVVIVIGNAAVEENPPVLLRK